MRSNKRLCENLCFVVGPRNCKNLTDIIGSDEKWNVSNEFIQQIHSGNFFTDKPDYFNSTLTMAQKIYMIDGLPFENPPSLEKGRR